MNIDNELKEQIGLFEQIKNHLGEISKKIGALTEEQRAVYNSGLEVKGKIDLLLKLQAKEKEDLSKSKTAGLTLPVGVQPVLPDAPAIVPTTTVLEPQQVAPVPVEPVKTPLEVI